MRIQALALAFCLTFIACSSDKKNKGGSTEVAATETERESLQSRATVSMQTQLADAGLSDEQISLVLAAAKAKTALLGADAAIGDVYYAFANGALAELNEILLASESFDAAAASQSVAAIVGHIVALASQDPLLKDKSEEEIAAAANLALQGSIAGLLQIDLLEKLTAEATTLRLLAPDIRGMDLETAMMAVQSQRAQILETELKGSLETVQKRNQDIALLNQGVSLWNKYLSLFPADAKATDTRDQSATAEKAILAELKTLKFITDDTTHTKAQVEAKIATLKTQIDTLSNEQQLGMLRLQSLSNKRNEAFEIMTNFIKKMSDSRSAVIGNMRLRFRSDLTEEEFLSANRSFDARLYGSVVAGFISYSKHPPFAEDSGSKLIEVYAQNYGDDFTSGVADEAMSVALKSLAGSLAEAGVDAAASTELITAFSQGMMKSLLALQSSPIKALERLAPLSSAAMEAFAGLENGPAFIGALGAGETAALTQHLLTLSEVTGLQTAYTDHLGKLKLTLQAFSNGEAAFDAYGENAKTAVDATEGLSGTHIEALKGPLISIMNASWDTGNP